MGVGFLSMVLIKRQSPARGQALGVLCQQSEPSCLCDGRANFVLMDALARIETHPESTVRIARARRGIRVALKAFHAACEEIVTQFSLRV
jgi:hypothetical protein